MISLVVLAGPTCVGKTITSLELAPLLNAEIISCDSRQIYKGMDIGTAKVSHDDRKKVPHHLIDLINPDESFTLADYIESAEKTINEIVARKKVPLLVGGTGLYIRALTEGYAVPLVPPNYFFRTELEEDAQKHGVQVLYKRLSLIDPVSASKLHSNDLRRIIRALEVYHATGMPISRWQSQNRLFKNYRVIKFGLTMDRMDLYNRINDRVCSQIKDGLVEEVKVLLSLGYSPNLAAFKTFGYQELIPYLHGIYSLEKGIELIKRNTRRFAKRQWTWFKKEPDLSWIEIIEIKDIPWRRLANNIYIEYCKKIGGEA